MSFEKSTKFEPKRKANVRKLTFYSPLLRARPGLLSVLCISPTVSPSSRANSHNWSVLRPGVLHSPKPECIHTINPKPIAWKNRFPVFSSCFSSVCFAVSKIYSIARLFLPLTLAALRFFFHYLVRFSSSSFSFPLPATSSISAPTLSASPPPPPPSRLTLTLRFQCVTALKIWQMCDEIPTPINPFSPGGGIGVWGRGWGGGWGGGMDLWRWRSTLSHNPTG